MFIPVESDEERWCPERVKVDDVSSIKHMMDAGKFESPYNSIDYRRNDGHELQEVFLRAQNFYSSSYAFACKMETSMMASCIEITFRRARAQRPGEKAQHQLLK